MFGLGGPIPGAAWELPTTLGLLYQFLGSALVVLPPFKCHRGTWTVCQVQQPHEKSEKLITVKRHYHLPWSDAERRANNSPKQC